MNEITREALEAIKIAFKEWSQNASDGWTTNCMKTADTLARQALDAEKGEDRLPPPKFTAHVARNTSHERFIAACCAMQGLVTQPNVAQALGQYKASPQMFAETPFAWAARYSVDFADSLITALAKETPQPKP